MTATANGAGDDRGEARLKAGTRTDRGRLPQPLYRPMKPGEEPKKARARLQKRDDSFRPVDPDKHQRVLVVRSIALDGPYNPPPPVLPRPTSGAGPPARPAAARGRPRDRRPVRQPGLPPPGPARGSRRLLKLYDRAEKEGERFENRVRLALEARPRLAGLPVPRRARPARRQARHELPDQRIRAGLAAVVLPLEQHARRRAVRPGGEGTAAARTSTPRCGGCSRTRSRPPSCRTSPASG